MEMLQRLLLMLLLAVCGSVTAQSAPMPDLAGFAVGEVWEWRQVDNRTRLEESRLTRTIVEKDGRREVLYTDGTQRPLSHMFFGEPSDKPWRVWPLEVGKRWSHDSNFKRADGVTGNNRQDARVVVHEEVVVPAGRFMAFKIEYDGFIRLSNGFHGRMTDTYWYAPEARADVKHVRRVGNTDFTRELLSYPRKAP